MDRVAYAIVALAGAVLAAAGVEPRGGDSADIAALVGYVVLGVGFVGVLRRRPPSDDRR
jgi:hypothetical protein